MSFFSCRESRFILKPSCGFLNKTFKCKEKFKQRTWLFLLPHLCYKTDSTIVQRQLEGRLIHWRTSEKANLNHNFPKLRYQKTSKINSIYVHLIIEIFSLKAIRARFIMHFEQTMNNPLLSKHFVWFHLNPYQNSLVHKLQFSFSKIYFYIHCDILKSSHFRLYVAEASRAVIKMLKKILFYVCN